MSHCSASFSKGFCGKYRALQVKHRLNIMWLSGRFRMLPFGSFHKWGKSLPSRISYTCLKKKCMSFAWNVHSFVYFFSFVYFCYHYNFLKGRLSEETGRKFIFLITMFGIFNLLVAGSKFIEPCQGLSLLLPTCWPIDTYSPPPPTPHTCTLNLIIGIYLSNKYICWNSEEKCNSEISNQLSFKFLVILWLVMKVFP